MRVGFDGVVFEGASCVVASAGMLVMFLSRGMLDCSRVDSRLIGVYPKKRVLLFFSMFRKTSFFLWRQ